MDLIKFKFVDGELDKMLRNLACYPTESNFDYFRGFIAGLLMCNYIKESKYNRFHRLAWFIYYGEDFDERNVV